MDQYYSPACALGGLITSNYLVFSYVGLRLILRKTRNEGILMKVPARVDARISHELKKLQAVVIDARKRDVNESDTALIVADTLCNVLGYKKLEEITTEHAIRGSFADLAVRVGNNMRFIVEVKAVNIDLKESHVTQVVNYAANLPVDWVVLTNGARWQIYKVNFSKPIDRTLFMDVDLCTASPKASEVKEFFGSLSKEVFTSSSISQVFQAKQIMSKHTIAALLLSDPVVGLVRREMRKMADGINPYMDEIRTIILEQVIKRELTETEEARLAEKAVKKALKHPRVAKTPAEKHKAQTIAPATSDDVTIAVKNPVT
jgi:hypothetical protein